MGRARRAERADDRDRHARLRLHGEGPRERLPEDRVHDVAAALAATARRGLREDGGGGREAARRYGFEGYTTDWHELLANSEIQLIDNSGPNNLHAEPTIAAAEAGKHVVCEKPLARSADESHEVWQRVAATGVKHMCAFNYRFVRGTPRARCWRPGKLGDVYLPEAHLQEWGDIDDQVWRFDREAAGSGALGDLGAHVIDLARYLVGEIASVSGPRGPQGGREVDDAFESVVEFENGAVGTIEASRFCPGRKNAFAWEINGSKG